jgi:predicted aconitase with swiveling domain
MNTSINAKLLVRSNATGDILACSDGISFWGGVDPDTGVIIDVHHPDYGASIAGRFLMMPTSRGSCSGSGVMLRRLLCFVMTRKSLHWGL